MSAVVWQQREQSIVLGPRDGLDHVTAVGGQEEETAAAGFGEMARGREVRCHAAWRATAAIGSRRVGPEGSAGRSFPRGVTAAALCACCAAATAGRHPGSRRATGDALNSTHRDVRAGNRRVALSTRGCANCPRPARALAAQAARGHAARERGCRVEAGHGGDVLGGADAVDMRPEPMEDARGKLSEGDTLAPAARGAGFGGAASVGVGGTSGSAARGGRERIGEGRARTRRSSTLPPAPRHARAPLRYRRAPPAGGGGRSHPACSAGLNLDHVNMRQLPVVQRRPVACLLVFGRVPGTPEVAAGDVLLPCLPCLTAPRPSPVKPRQAVGCVLV
eukprot:scaffold4840_cov115-Isochrysis_galbana.AAC.26